MKSPQVAARVATGIFRGSLVRFMFTLMCVSMHPLIESNRGRASESGTSKCNSK